MRLQTGGEPRSPAIELVECARALGKLDELAAKIEAIPLDDSTAGKQALLGLIAIARGDIPSATKSISDVTTRVSKQSTTGEIWRRWPELSLAARTAGRPELVKPARALAEAMAHQIDKNAPPEAQSSPPRETWIRQVKHLRARLDLLAQAEQGASGSTRPFGADSESGPWARVSHTRSQTRGEAYPIVHWKIADKEMTHYPGHDRDLLYLSVPLRGDFQLDCELSSGPFRMIRAAYGGLAVGPKLELKSLDRSQFGRPQPDVPLSPPIDKLGEWFAFRLASKGGRVTAFVNGRKIHEAAAPADSDPWVTILSQGMEMGTVRKFALTGNPQVPEKINLSAMPDLAGWLPDEYGEGMDGDNADWQKRGDEIVGLQVEEAGAGTSRESLLKYHRPLLEDGRVEYEFYYEPGQVMVHPALDRLAFLLDPDGVKIHALTDGAFERSGLAPDNIRDEPENRRGPTSLPLKPREWNRLVLKLAGDKVTLELNDQAIYVRSIEPTNQRFFGLFHYADVTQVRVRKVVHQGNWPRSLPSSLRAN